MRAVSLYHSVVLAALAGVSFSAFAQTPASLTGSVTDAKGALVPHAHVAIHTANHTVTRHTTADETGHFSFSALPAGSYVLDADAPGFSTSHQNAVQVSDDKPTELTLTLKLADLNEQIDVEADATNSIAAQLAPMDARLDERSARTELNQHYLENFLPPTADYGEAVNMAPGTFTTNSNGVGLGQSNTYFRGFPDGDYDIDFDGLPFYDTNTPSHHSWAFFPSQFLGGIDFDRSPGTASTIGPTPFGGSIHLLSKNLLSSQNIRGGFTYGSFNTRLFDGAFDSGPFGPGGKLNLDLDIHHMASDGYQTFNFQTRNAGELKMEFRPTSKTTVTGFAGVIWLDANTPNFSATRCQMYGVGCAAGTPYAGAGINFLMTAADPNNPYSYVNNYYHVPTDFEYVGVRSELGKHFILEFHPYTYNYDNSEKYANTKTAIADSTTINGSSTYQGLPVIDCSSSKAAGSKACGVDKYNSYRKYGETGQISQVSRFGILRAGLWYEWAHTNRHQFPSDPANHWKDQALSNFNEQFWTNSYQPFAEYQWYVTPKLSITPGVKWAYYTISTKQFADNGKTIGGLGTNDPNSFITNNGSYLATLPSIDANYRLRTNWSVYGQIAAGSVVPPSKVFDYQQSAAGTPVKTLPKQQKNTTYQFGTVVKLKRATLDADFYHVYFQNSYSSTLDPTGEPVYHLNPSSITKGFEAESNIYLLGGLSLYLNGSVGRAFYHGQLAVCPDSANPCGDSLKVNVDAPSGLWVQNTPTDTEAEALTYQKHGLDLGIFNKRVGSLRQDNGAYHNQAVIDPFQTTNLYFNYTVHAGRWAKLDNTRLGVSFNNLFNEHSMTGDSIAGNAATLPLAGHAGYTDPFNTNGMTPISGGDNISIMSARSVTFTLQVGISPHGR